MLSAELPWFHARLADAANEASELASGADSLTYGQAAPVIQRITSRLLSSDIAYGDCVVAEIPSTLSGALLVLALIDSRISCLPLPPEGVEAREGSAFCGVPTFCKARIRVNETVSDPTDVDAWLCIAQEGSYREGRDATLPEVPSTFRRTSGSLSAPKLVVMPYAHECVNAREIVRVLGFRREDRLSLPVPIFHTFGAEMLIGAVMIGMSVDVQPRSNVLKLLEREADWNPTVTVLSPLHCEWLARTRRRPRPYRLTITGGDRIGRSTAERYEALHGPLLVAYGSTETGGVAYSRLEDPADVRLSSVVYPRPGVRVRVDESPESIFGGDGDAAGVLSICNPGSFLGYVDLQGNPLASPSIDGHGWYRSGDIAVLRGVGMQVLGRWDLSINRDGLLLPLSDVESQARQIPEVSEAVAVPGGESIRGRELALFCTLSAGERTTPAQLRQACARVLPDYAVPDVVLVIDQMPRLPAGKPDRRQLAQLLKLQR